MGDARPVKDGEHVQEGLGPEIEDVVVGDRDGVDVGCLQHRDVAGCGTEVELLRGRHGRPPVGDDAFEVAGPPVGLQESGKGVTPGIISGPVL